MSEAAPMTAAPAAPAAPAGAALPAGAQPKLIVIRGQRINVEYPVYEGLNFIGRADEKPVDIDLENQEPPERIWSSRQHAFITFENAMLTIEDLNSANGTFVNRARVYPGQKCPLNVGDVVQVGTVQMKMAIDPASMEVVEAADATPMAPVMAEAAPVMAEEAPMAAFPPAAAYGTAIVATPPQPKRQVSTGFSPATPPFDPIDRDQPLCPGQDHLFWLEVGSPIAGSIELEPTELDVTALPADAVLQVVLFAYPDEIECLATKGTLVLGRDGSVRAARQPSEFAADVPAELRERRLFFPVRTPAREGNFKLRCHVYHGAVLLQSRVIEAAVRTATAPLPRALSARIDYVRSPSLHPAALAHVEPVEMSILLNDNGHSTHSLRFFGSGQWASDAHFEGDELKQLIDLVRSTPHEVSWGAPGPWDDRDNRMYKYPNGRGEREQLRADLSRLAKAGFRLYAAIGDRLSGDLSPAQLREKLRPSIRIQGIAKEDELLCIATDFEHIAPNPVLLDVFETLRKRWRGDNGRACEGWVVAIVLVDILGVFVLIVGENALLRPPNALIGVGDEIGIRVANTLPNVVPADGTVWLESEYPTFFPPGAKGV